MTIDSEKKSFDKEAMKRLRKNRKTFVQAASAKMREQKKRIRAIKEQLQQGSKTVPELASAIGVESAEVLWYLAALKKYGEIQEAEKDGAYFRYSLNTASQDGH